MNRSRRVPAIAAIVAILLGAWIVDNQVRRPEEKVTTDVHAPVGARPGSLSSAWFCAGASATSDGSANGTVVIANAGRRALNGTVTVVPTEGEPKQVNISVASTAQSSVRLIDVLNAPYASALVELDGGEAAVELTATGPLGDSVTPCASSAGATWLFAEGVTTKDATEVISLFNPFPEDAIVDMVFTTEEGQVTPQALTGLSVRGKGLTAVNLGDHVQRRESVSTRIKARAGRLVASRLQTFDGSSGRKGMSVTLGAAAPGDAWYFPQGFLMEGITERFQIFNPHAEEAKVRVELALEQGQAEPIELTISPEARVTLTANDEARIPKSVAHAVTIRSVNGVTVVAERTVDAASPATRSGLGIAMGARLPALRALVAAGQLDEANDGWLIVQNPNDRPAKVSVTLFDNGVPVTPSTLTNVVVPARQQVTFRLADHLRKGATPLLVVADSRVVSERNTFRLKGPGLSMSTAIPLRP